MKEEILHLLIHYLIPQKAAAGPRLGRLHQEPAALFLGGLSAGSWVSTEQLGLNWCSSWAPAVLAVL